MLGIIYIIMETDFWFRQMAGSSGVVQCVLCIKNLQLYPQLTTSLFQFQLQVKSPKVDYSTCKQSLNKLIHFTLNNSYRQN